jgi:chemotaxis signal transduction protein
LAAAPSIENIAGLLIFQIADIEFCTDLKLITGIKKSNEVTSGSEVMTDLSDNQEYSIIDFADLYKVHLKDDNESARILLLQIYGNTVSFYVDRVTEIISLDKLFIEQSIRMQPSCGIEYISSIMTIQNRSFYFPDYGLIARQVQKSKQRLNNFTPGKVICLSSDED